MMKKNVTSPVTIISIIVKLVNIKLGEFNVTLEKMKFNREQRDRL